ncbi:MAG: helix-turn-helix domain-containing protein, partial [Lachnospiraceae bacterium]|nr:helix-turn-helix domain-containing protein [Lachnospiraceae bacterium]
LLKQMDSPKEPRHFPTASEERILEQEFQDPSSNSGVSNEFFCIRDLSNAREQCDFAVKYAMLKKISFPHVCYYKDCFLSHLLSKTQPTYQKMFYASGEYQRLKDYDLANPKENLCKIYMSYIKHHTNITDTAAELFMHRNTILNKIKKIAEILGVNINDLHTQILFSLVYESENP